MAHVEDRWRPDENGRVDRSRLRWRARYVGPDGNERSKSFRLKRDAQSWLKRETAGLVTGGWTDPRAGRRRFREVADQWWLSWSQNPARSPSALQATEARLRLHVRPHFDGLQLQDVQAAVVAEWQRRLAAQIGHATLMSCRTILHGILQTAVDQRWIPVNPLVLVPAPKQPIDPDALLGRVKRRAHTPEEFGVFLAAVSPGFRDQFLVQVGTGLRPGELCGLRVHRINLAREYLEVVDVRYEAGRFGTGYKDRPKSLASIRRVPLAPIVVEALRRQLPGSDGDPSALALTAPGGANGVAEGSRVAVSISGLRRAYRRAAVDAGLAGALLVKGPHDLRHTFSTWLEDAGIPPRVIDEVMGHSAGRRGEQHGSVVGVGYRHTTPEMEQRIRDAIQQRLTLAWSIAGKPEVVAEVEANRATRLRATAQKRPQTPESAAG